ncbi:arginyl-tRNA synthetase [Intrasporangium chromatireducens Q5-1]|uniref:Arginine--tRNA ligase n=1 Tax=Intrasporangium chromatireducens Q5-1 TaxID=584657 RepID=W9GQU8_9MICO|nr:arginine--tRNA ligase [Intrasporangium chromatireducens]EWT07203.1 arginyl-tRNA synthetase [Intrasporangium chromatireducens Q5-1]
MVSPLVALTPKVQSAIAAVLGDDFREVDPVLRPSQFADVQVNAALALAKRVGMPPRDLATKIVDALELDGVCDKVEVSGPGFINLTYSNDWIASLLGEVDTDSRLGVPVQERENIPIDYSAPNVAKEMHVGHLRTTIVGDSLARTLEHLGHHVIRQNHIGDWGTPFGMLIEHLLEVGEDSEEAGLLLTDPNAFYQAARVKFDTAEKAEPGGSAGDFDVRARARVVKLQGGDEATLAHWQRLVDLSKAYFNKVYSTLGVTLTDEDLAGESMYNDELGKVCDELEAKGIATVSDGALCVFLDGYTGREGKPVPLIIRKSDGGYGYATTDLATIKYRVGELHAHRVLYVIGAPQALHLNMVWDTARKAGWLPADVTPVHIQIGNVLGEDRKILKTRSGKPLRLMMLLDEAVEKAQSVIDEARPDLDAETRATIARQIGIGAVKYADLSVAHDSEYVFDLERMVSLTGNTGPYLQYVGARVRSIFRQVGLEPAAQHAPVVLTEEHERDLAKRLLDFADVVVAVGAEYEPHRLCGYLFELAQSFSAFYENCPVLKAETDEVKESRLTLSALVLRTMVTGLSLLGIEAPERM